MGQPSDALWDDLSELADAFAEAGRRLLAASRDMLAPGQPPSRSLLDEAHDLAARFDRLRDRARALAGRLSVPVRAVENLKDLARLLDALSEAEARRGVMAGDEPGAIRAE